MDDIPFTVFMVRSKSDPTFIILCTEPFVEKWVEQVLNRAEEPEVQIMTGPQLIKLIKTNHQFN